METRRFECRSAPRNARPERGARRPTTGASPMPDATAEASEPSPPDATAKAARIQSLPVPAGMLGLRRRLRVLHRHSSLGKATPERRLPGGPLPAGRPSRPRPHRRRRGPLSMVDRRRRHPLRRTPQHRRRAGRHERCVALRWAGSSRWARSAPWPAGSTAEWPPTATASAGPAPPQAATAEPAPAAEPPHR